MSDTGDIYRMARQSAKNGKEARRHKAKLLFSDPDTGLLPAEWKIHTPYCWSIAVGNDRFVYWPSTGRWKWKGLISKGTPQAAHKFLSAIR